MLYLYFKRFLDIIFAITVIFFLLPIYIIISFAIFLQDGNSFIFKQKRIGQFGKEFSFYKFRTMPINTPDVVSIKKDEIEITFFGKFLRRFNLDELPQFFNVLIGDMSVMGPRPSLISQINLIELRKKNGSINIRPGITGWAQVNSYDNMPETEKAHYDGEYYNELSLYLDIKIFFKTLIYFTKKPPTY